MGTLPADSAKVLTSTWVRQQSPSAVLFHRHRFEKVITAVEVIADFLAVFSTLILSAVLYEFIGLGKRLHYGPEKLLLAAFGFSFLFILLMERDGGYRSANSLLRIRETERVLRVSVIAFSLLFLSTVIVAHMISRGMLLCAFVMVPITLAIEKQLVYGFVSILRARGHGTQNVLIYGAGETGKRLFSALTRSPKLGLRPVAIVDDNPNLAGRVVHETGYRHQHSLVVKGGPLTRHLIQKLNARVLIVGIPSLPLERLNAIAEEAFFAGSVVAFVPRVNHRPDPGTLGYADIDGILIASLLPPLEKPWYEFCKRVFDVMGAAVLILTSAPLWIMIAILVKLDSRGPIFFRQVRVGRNGALFTLLKFRSMYVDSPRYGYHPTCAEDSRITKMGRILRRTSLDELPQLLNVIRGEMSLVGPRPEMPFIVEAYDTRQRQRLQVTPGITGLWQISADRASLIHENLQYDLYYIRHRNFFMDLALLLHTAIFAMRGT